MPDPDKDDVARALERMASGQSDAPTPQPKPRVGTPPKVRVNPAVPHSQAQKPVQKIARPAAPGAASPARAAAPASVARSLQESLKGAKVITTARRVPPRTAPAMGLRRTLIPILLTGGAILMALATVRYAWNSIDNPTLDLPRGIVIAMVALGLVCWLLAAANMLAVRRGMRKVDG